MRNEQGVSLLQVVVGVMISLVLMTVVGLYVMGYIEDARLASEIREVEELELRMLAGEELSMEPAKIEDLKEEVREVLGYHQAKGTKMEEVVFKNRTNNVDGNVYVGKLSVKEKELTEEFELTSGSLKRIEGDWYTFGEDRRGMDRVEEGNRDNKRLDGGNGHSISVNDKGEVFTWGRSNSGQLGRDMMVTSASYPGKVRNLPIVRSVEAGELSSYIVTEDGDLYASGMNSQGQLGKGEERTIDTFEKVYGLPVVRSVSAGSRGRHALVLTEEGEVWGAGRNSNGEVGSGSDEDEVVAFERIEELDNIVEVSAGEMHSLALDSEGNVYAWGFNRYGSTGTGASSIRPREVTGLDEKVVSIGAGSFTSIALTEKGDLYVWGLDREGQLGLNDEESYFRPVLNDKVEGDIKELFVGVSYAFVLTEDGDIWSWGKNGYGELGDGGVGYDYEPVKREDLPDFVEFGFGAYGVRGLLKDGSVYSWGRNEFGQIGGGTLSGSLVPKKIDLDLVE